MDEMRALLDSLMGSDRNSLLADSARPSFKDPGVCHSYLVDFCPHDLFPNTKSDLGPCPNKHSNSLRDQYLTDPEYEYYKVKYEKEFFGVLSRLVDGVEERIRRGHQRIIGPDEAHVEQEKQRKMDQMKEKISQLLKKAQEAGEKGNIAEAETHTRQVAEIRCELDRLISPGQDHLPISNQEKSLRVCATCGAMQSLGDATSRFESHVAGKQHIGYERVRASYNALKSKYYPDNKSSEPKSDRLKEEDSSSHRLPNEDHDTSAAKSHRRRPPPSHSHKRSSLSPPRSRHRRPLNYEDRSRSRHVNSPRHRVRTSPRSRPRDCSSTPSSRRRHHRYRPRSPESEVLSNHHERHRQRRSP